MAVATATERKTYAIFRWSLAALAALILITLFIPAFVLGVLVLLPVVALCGGQWKTTRERIARRIERETIRVNAITRSCTDTTGH